MGQVRGIKIETAFEKELNRRTKEKYDLLVAKSTYEKNKLEITTIKLALLLSIVFNLIQLSTQ